MDIFTKLGQEIESLWRSNHYDERVFAPLATRALQKAQIHRQIKANDVLDWLLASETLPEQMDIAGMFGEPPVTIYRGRRFTIQVIFWFTASTSIHDHSFSGAFQVLEGSSLHSTYTFHERQRFTAHFLLGDVRLCRAEWLQRGDVTAIDSTLVHCLYHIDAPSASIVVRTNRDAESYPQYEYHPPSIAFDWFYEEPIVKRWLQALSLLIRTKHPEYEARAVKLIKRNDLHTVFLILQQAGRMLRDAACLERLFDAALRHHGSAGENVVAALRTQIFRHKFYKLRNAVREPDLRFFLALLQNLPHRKAIVEMIRRYDPDADPRGRIISWAHALSGVERIGVDFRGDLERVLFEGLLDDCSNEQLLDRLRGQFAPSTVDAQAEAILAHASRMQQTLLKPLFHKDHI